MKTGTSAKYIFTRHALVLASILNVLLCIMVTGDRSFLTMVASVVPPIAMINLVFSFFRWKNAQDVQIVEWFGDIPRNR